MASPEMVELLLDHGADPQEDQNYPLCKACAVGNFEMAQLLIQRGADVHANNDEA